jgi:hypothetical protein
MGSQQWVGGSKADKYEELVEVEQLNTGRLQWVCGTKADKYGELVEVQQLNTGS